MERLQKYLANAGVASRRACEKYIEEGRVKVNGEVVKELGTKVDSLKDKVEFDNKLVKIKTSSVYIMLNKPEGYVTTVKDDRNRPTVIDLLKGVKERVFPIGRLDFETEGLLLLTNDGNVAYRLTHPKYKVYKTYEALVGGKPNEEKLEKLKKGIMLEDGMTAPAILKVVKKFSDKTLIEIKIREGRNRQVRRMFKAINHPVLKLKRTEQGILSLNSLEKGKYRYLTREEINYLKKI